MLLDSAQHPGTLFLPLRQHSFTGCTAGVCVAFRLHYPPSPAVQLSAVRGTVMRAYTGSLQLGATTRQTGPINRS